ncbi:MAG: hypothetical protein QME87_13430 [Bacillota bacterium]|nr:hypothetical protein [Bacillota bacterium]
MDVVDAVRWEWQRGLPVPGAILRHGRFVPVAEILDRWVEAGKWWEGEETETIFFFRVQLGDGSVRQLGHPLGGQGKPDGCALAEGIRQPDGNGSRSSRNRRCG